MRAQEIAYMLLDCIEARKAYGRQEGMMPFEYDLDIEVKQDSVELYIWGGGIVLNEDGTWYWNDTSGG